MTGNYWIDALLVAQIAIIGYFAAPIVVDLSRHIRSAVYWRLQKRRACRDPHTALRRELAFWGVDLSDLSDEELEERVATASRLIAGAGISSEAAARSMASVFGAVEGEP